MRLTGLALAGLALLGCLAPAGAQQDALTGRQQAKCERYTKSWHEALARRGTKGLGQTFRDSHDRFLASGCTARADVCPRSPEELELANIMVILAMNAGMSSTFLPFTCRN